jgi:aspartokinase/homoserine dehydrogenase 1
MQRVADIVERETSARAGVVLSASRGVTDALLALITQAERQQPVDDAVHALRERHVEMARTLIPGTSADAYTEVLDRDCQDIAGILHAVHLTRSASSAVRDLVAGFGEIWSTRLFARYLAARGRRPGRVIWVDARDVVRVDWSALGPSVRWDESRANALQIIPGDVDATLVITGFIARTADGLQTTLGRNGSDFSASIFGDLLDAEEIVIWTDVDGVLSADPRRVPDARVIDSLSYHEAMELAYFGAKVIHPQTMAPAVEKRIPIWIRNTFAPDKAGSLICESPNSAHPVKGITSIDGIALVNVEGAGMIGVPGTAQRLFGALREDGISVILISQGSSEHSICFAIPHSEAERTARTVRHAFHAELNGGQIQNVDVIRGCSILSVVGDGMAGTPGIAAQVFGSLGASGVNVRAIAQGSSERNISVVIDERQTTRALRSVHAGFISHHTRSRSALSAPEPSAACCSINSHRNRRG